MIRISKKNVLSQKCGRTPLACGIALFVNTQLQVSINNKENKLGLSCAKLITNLSYLKKMASAWFKPMPASFDTLMAGWLAYCDYIAKSLATNII